MHQRNIQTVTKELSAAGESNLQANLQSELAII